MCTASWSEGSDRLTLCFSRDERKTRTEAELPKIHSITGQSVLAAIDPVGGGSWAAVNGSGLCVFLLNNYQATSNLRLDRPGLKSRGHLPLEFAGFESKSAARSAFRRTELDCYNPFILCFADLKGVEGMAWDGRTLQSVDLSSGMVTTCSFRTDEIEPYRRARLEQIKAGKRQFGEREQREFHTELLHPDAAFNVLMLRDESRTHSISTVCIEPKRVRYRYEPVIGETRRLAEANVTAFDVSQESVAP